jgi:excisionase family DNA binding protein
MTSSGNTLTTNEYSKISGLSASTISKMLRKGKLRGQKVGGKWAIDASEAQQIQFGAEQTNKQGQETPKPVYKEATPPKTANNKTYDLETFTRMTYLTEQGVRQWIKTGRLSGSVDDNGNLLVDADNLDRPEIRHLIRN